MSTRQVLTLVGQIVGGMYGGPWGAAIGGMLGGAIGGYVDPETIQGPKIGDAQLQTSRDGVPRPIVYGLGPIVGNLIDRGELQIVKVTERQDAKGGTGPEVESEEAYMTYAIRICEASLQADGTTGIIGVRRIWENERLVYDAREGPDPGEELEDYDEYQSVLDRFVHVQSGNEKWISNKRIYLGGEDQLPDSALEAIHGVGNVPAYRGSAYIVFENENLTKWGGAIPTYRFEVIGRGSGGTPTYTRHDVKQYSKFRNAHWPLADDEANYTLVGDRFSTDYTPLSGLTGTTVEEIIAQATMYGATPTQYLGFASRNEITYGFDLTTETYDPTDVDTVYLLFNNPTQIEGYLTYEAYGAGGTICSATSEGHWLCDKRGALVTKADQSGWVYSGPYETFQDCTETSAVVGMYPLVIAATRKKVCSLTPTYGRPRHLQGPVLLPDAPGFEIDYFTGDVKPVEEATTVSGTFKILQAEDKQLASWGLYYNLYDVGPAIENTDARYASQSYWESVYADAVARGEIAAGLTYGVDYPVAATSVCRHVATYSTVAADGLYLYEIIDDLCERCGITADKRDTTELTDLVFGYVLGRQMNHAEAIRGTQGAYLFDMPEFDLKIRGVKRGAASAGTITDTDLVYTGGDDPSETLVRDQAVEYPRKLHVISYDPVTTYVPTKETAERRSGNVESLNEVTIALALTLDHDDRAQIADRSLKVAWADAQGTIEFSVPDYLSKYTPADIFTFNSKRYRIDRVQQHDGFLTWECRYDRQSAYTSTLTGSQPLSPTDPPVSRVAGPTLLTVLNIPPQSESDEYSGVYIAVAGMASGWGGATVQMSTDDGATWVTVVAQVKAPTPQGYLTTTLADTSGSPSDDDFGVHVYGGALETVSDAQIALGMNRFAVSTDEGDTWEILSARDVAEVDDYRYTLSHLTRGLDATTVESYGAGDFFCALTNLTYIPIDASLDGEAILFRAVTLGTSADNAYEVEIVYDVQNIVWDGGAP